MADVGGGEPAGRGSRKVRGNAESPLGKDGELVEGALGEALGVSGAPAVRIQLSVW
ncbi:hypothetical protein GCM10014715_32850 [Streptomyces spiralis]|uniref:Uncharacterized protein n=1 Tax=Streptomyces spiralis TaxID=66376 RepID=A0A919DSD6_9ACTN|nr:hypothetical protein GCM10014715_32850 [Streptomyces spiralis]